MKILMVCLGNICRSPLAEGILKDKCKKKGLNWEIDSAGTGRWQVGNQPDKRSIEVAKNHGIDITDQRARSVNSNDYGHYDIIYAMDTMNLRDLKAWVVDANEETKIKLILKEIEGYPIDSVPDPYWNDNGFEAVFNMLDKACDAIIKKYG